MATVPGPDILAAAGAAFALPPGQAGLLVIMAAPAGTGRGAAGDAAAAGTVLIVLAAAAFAVTRAIVRPLRRAARLAAGARPGDNRGARRD
jgi:hypothetical protein